MDVRCRRGGKICESIIKAAIPLCQEVSSASASKKETTAPVRKRRKSNLPNKTVSATRVRRFKRKSTIGAVRKVKRRRRPKKKR